MTYYSRCDVANETSFWCSVSVIVNGGSVAELNLIGNKLLLSFMDVNITFSLLIHDAHYVIFSLTHFRILIHEDLKTNVKLELEVHAKMMFLKIKIYVKTCLVCRKISAPNYQNKSFWHTLCAPLLR